MRRLPLVLAVLLFGQSSEARVRAVSHPIAWQQPACGGIQGLASIRFLDPAGTVRKSYFYAINQWARAITPGVVSNTLYTLYERRLYESTNAGCTWSLRAPIEVADDAVDFGIYPARGRVYVQSGLKLTRITGPTVEAFDLPARFFGMAVNPADSLHLRAVASRGEFFESLDGGIVWNQVGMLDAGSIYSVAFDPGNFDHVLVGLYLYRGGNGTGITTRDGGRSWTSTPFPSNVLAYTSAFSPADSRVVWMVGYDLTNSRMHLYRSNDGGTTFAAVHSSDPRFEGIRRVLAPHPRDPNVVATLFNGIGIVDNQGMTILVPNTGIGSMVWSPAGTLYFSAPDEWWEH